MANIALDPAEYLAKKYLPKGAVIISYERVEDDRPFEVRPLVNKYARFIIVYRYNGETYRANVPTQRGTNK